MNLTELEKAITECNNGNLNFNLRSNLIAFLYKKKWYPLRATVNRAIVINNKTIELTTHNALLELVILLPYTRVKKIEFLNNFPVEINSDDTLEEVNKISIILQQLT